MYDNYFTTVDVKYKRSFTYNMTTPPSATPVSLDDAKAFLRISGTAEDAVLCILINAATIAAQQYMNRVLINTGFTTYRDDFNDDMLIRRSKLQSIESIEYKKQGALVAVDPSIYDFTDESGYSTVLLREEASFPTDNDDTMESVKIMFTAGYGDSSEAVPAPIVLGLLNHIASLYSNRGDCGDCGSSSAGLPSNTVMLYNQYRILNIGSSDRSIPSGSINSIGYRL